MKVGALQDETLVEHVGGILPSCPWKKVESCNCHGLGKGKECDYRQETSTGKELCYWFLFTACLHFLS